MQLSNTFPTRGEKTCLVQDIGQLAAGTLNSEQQADSPGAAPAVPLASLLTRATHKAMTCNAEGIYLCPLTQAVLAYSAGNTYAQHQLKPQ